MTKINNTPNVILNFGFTCPEPTDSMKKYPKIFAKWAEKRAFYTCNSEWNIVEYLNKQEKAQIDDLTKKVGKEKLADSKAVDYNKQIYEDIFGYLEKRGSNKTTGLFNDKKVFTEDEVKNLRDDLRKTESIVWHGYISFSEKHTAKFTTQEQAQQFLNRTFNAFIDQTHLRKNNIELIASLHTDKPWHHHIHFVFYEKEKTKRKDGTYSYTRKGMVDQNALQNWLVSSEMVVGESKFHMFRDEIKKELDLADGKNDYGRNLRMAKECLRKLAKELPESGHTYYNDKNMDKCRPLVDETVKYLLNVNESASNTYKAAMKDLQEKQLQVDEIVKRSNLTIQDDEVELVV